MAQRVRLTARSGVATGGRVLCGVLVPPRTCRSSAQSLDVTGIFTAVPARGGQRCAWGDANAGSCRRHFHPDGPTLSGFRGARARCGGLLRYRQRPRRC
jgi:hypothetical protein